MTDCHPKEALRCPKKIKKKKNTPLKIVHFTPDSTVHYIPDFIVHFTPEYSLIEKFMSQTLSDDGKREFVTRGGSDREFLKQLVLELDVRYGNK